MRVLYFWLTMGEYHFARMDAIAEVVDELIVVEATNLDDHYWAIDKRTSKWKHQVLFPNELLDYKVTGKAFNALKRVIEQFKPDIVINAAGFFHPESFVMSRYLKRKNIISVLWSESTLHDNPSLWLKNLVKKVYLKQYDGALVAGKRHFDYLHQLGMSIDKIAIVGNVVDNSLFTQQPLPDRKGILFVGRLLPIKNVHTLLVAYKQLVDTWNDNSLPQLTIIGDGPERKQLEQFSEKNGLNVLFTGNLQPDQVREWYQKSTVFVLPSTSEPWGLVINEAMASGLAVIVSSQCGSVDDLIVPEVTGLICDPNDAQSVTECMKRVLLDESLQYKLAKNAREHIQRFSPQSYAEKSAAFLRTL